MKNYLLTGLLLLLLSACEKNPAITGPAKAQSPTMDLMLTESQVRLANIQTREAGTQTLQQARVINGRLKENATLTAVISSRAAGRIERLFYKEVGRSVRKGEPLYELYSEALLTYQQEFLFAREQAAAMSENKPHYETIELAARKKLELYGLTSGQINQLVVLGKAQPRITFLAPSAGIIKSVEASEGQYVAEGSPLYAMENLTSLWVEADLYANEADWVREGDKVLVQVEGQQQQEGRVDFISPEFKSNSQVWVMRATISNTSGQFKPGMPAEVIVHQPAIQALVLPVQAVIRSAAGTHVYVETEHHVFQPRTVVTGLENFSEVQILDGLAAGERVAVSGAYLIYSEFILKHGMNPMEHTHH